MRKFFIVFAIVLLAVPAFAADNPVAEGNFVVSMPVLSFEEGSGDLYEDTSGIGLFAGEYELGVQYFVIPNLAIGGVVGYINADVGDYSVTELTFGPLVNYYFTIDGKMFPYAGGGFLYQSTDYDGSKETETSILIQGGIAFMLGKNLAAYGELFYVRDSVKPDQGDSVDGSILGLTAGFKAFF